MSTIRSDTGDGAAEVASVTQPSARAPRPLLRRVGWSTFFVCAVLALVMGAGFLWFVWRVPVEEAPLSRDADGIVALTGGASRITDAIELLASGRGKRLLISGANRATNSNEISRLNPEFERWVRCCVDFDRSLNAAGQCDRDQALGGEPRFPLADRGHVELSHAARARRDRSPAPRCRARAFCRGDGS